METLFDERQTLFEAVKETFPTVCFIQVSSLGKTQTADRDLNTHEWTYQDVYNFNELKKEVPFSDWDMEDHRVKGDYISVQIGIPLLRYVHRFIGVTVPLPLEKNKMVTANSFIQTKDTSIEGKTAESYLKKTLEEWLETTSYYRYVNARERCDEYKEELMAKTWSPLRLSRWLEAGLSMDDE